MPKLDIALLFPKYKYNLSILIQKCRMLIIVSIIIYNFFYHLYQLLLIFLRFIISNLRLHYLKKNITTNKCCNPFAKFGCIIKKKSVLFLITDREDVALFFNFVSAVCESGFRNLNSGNN